MTRRLPLFGKQFDPVPLSGVRVAIEPAASGGNGIAP